MFIIISSSSSLAAVRGPRCNQSLVHHLACCRARELLGGMRARHACVCPRGWMVCLLGLNSGISRSFTFALLSSGKIHVGTTEPLLLLSWEMFALELRGGLAF